MRLESEEVGWEEVREVREPKGKGKHSSRVLSHCAPRDFIPAASPRDGQVQNAVPRATVRSQLPGRAELG